MKMPKSHFNQMETPYDDDDPNDEFSEEDVETKKITIKVENYDQIMKKPIRMKVESDIELRWLMIDVGDKMGFGCNGFKYKFMFNGARVRDTDTPLKLNMIDNDVIYVCTKSYYQTNPGLHGHNADCYVTLCIRMHKKPDTFLRVVRTEPLLHQLKRLYHNDKARQPLSVCFACNGVKLQGDAKVSQLSLEDGDIIDAFSFDECSSSSSKIAPTIRSGSEVNCNGKMPSKRPRISATSQGKLKDIPSGVPPMRVYPSGAPPRPAVVHHPPYPDVVTRRSTRIDPPQPWYQHAPLHPSHGHQPSTSHLSTNPGKADDNGEEEEEEEGEEEEEEEEEAEAEYEDEEEEEDKFDPHKKQKVARTASIQKCPTQARDAKLHRNVPPPLVLKNGGMCPRPLVTYKSSPESHLRRQKNHFDWMSSRHLQTTHGREKTYGSEESDSEEYDY